MNTSITRRQTLLCFFGASLRAGTGVGRTVRLPLRTRVEVFKGSGIWQEVHFDKDFPVAETAIVICDMWDNHWCKGAAQRVEVLARKMAPVIEQARAGGIRII